MTSCLYTVHELKVNWRIKTKFIHWQQALGVGG